MLEMNSSEIIKELTEENTILRIIVDLMDKQPNGWQELVENLKTKIRL